MKKIVLKFGIISGVLASILMAGTLPFEDKIGHSYLVGYATIVASFLLVYFGVRSYRNNVGDGTISFGRSIGSRAGDMRGLLLYRHPLRLPALVLIPARTRKSRYR